MPFRFPRLTLAVMPILIAALVQSCGGPEKAIEESLRANVLFFANFEKGVDALDCVGNPLANFDTANTHLTEGGAANGCLSFDPNAGALNYAAKANFPYKANQAWSGSIAFWLNVDMQSFEANYPEPFHIGKKDDTGYPWDDAVIFLDFKKSDGALRYGCYPNKTQEITDQMVAKRVISVPVDWKAGEWHHVVLTFSNFNSGKADAEWALFIDGVEKGRKRGLQQDVTWDIANQSMRFNHYKYPGKIDEIAVFEKVLNAADAKYLTAPRKKLSELFYKKGERR